MHELTTTELDLVAGGFSVYYSPPPVIDPNVLAAAQAGSKTPGEYDNPNPIDWRA